MIWYVQETLILSLQYILFVFLKELYSQEYENHLGILAKNLVTTVCDRLVLNQRRLRFEFCVLNFLSREKLTQKFKQVEPKAEQLIVNNL